MEALTNLNVTREQAKAQGPRGRSQGLRGRRFATIGLMGLFLALALLAGADNAVVLRPVASMYSGASEDTDVVSQAICGANVTLLESRPGWRRVRTADEYTGWMPAAALKAGLPYGTSGRVAEVASLFAHIYREPDVTRHQPLLTAPFEGRLEVVAEPAGNERWLQVRLPDDRSGWVQRGDVEFSPKTLSIEETVALARRFLGLPYTWGGTSSFGYDCSGFTQMLCHRRGILMPRDAGPQAQWSGVAPVAREDLRPGDLLFFGGSVEKITHTGMYIGGGQFIHATTYLHPVVQISDLGDAHWTALLVAMRRPR